MLRKMQVHGSRRASGSIAVAVSLSSIMAFAFANQLSLRPSGRAVTIQSHHDKADSTHHAVSFAKQPAVQAAPAASPQFELLRSVVAGGGGMSKNPDQTLILDGTIGQPAAGNTSNSDNGQYSVSGGFSQSGESAAATPTPTPTATPSPTPTPIPTLGNYPDTIVPLSSNKTVTPDAAPTNTTSINVSTSTNFEGQLAGNPTTGEVRVTDAHPVGTYIVTVRAFDSAGASATRTFTLTVTTPATCNPVNFAAPINFGVGTTPFSVAVGDFNGDGKQDLATANNTSFDVSVLLGNGAGGFGAATTFGVGTYPDSVVVGDFNGDGKQDLAIANNNSENVSVLLGDGAGGFTAAVDFGVGDVPRSLAVGDFNGDGRQDLAAANLASIANNPDNVAVLLGDGAGSFSAATKFTVGTGPESIAIGDFNGDGKQDLATANDISGEVSVLLGDGAGGFAPAVAFGVGNGPRSVVVGDFNGDGQQDLATGNSNSNNVSVLLGNGAGGFARATNFGVGDNSPHSVTVGDFNGDGKQDLAAAGSGSNSVTVLLGNGAGGFAAATNFGAGDVPVSVVVGDFNGDGKQDFATANANSNNVSILLRDCAAPTPTPTPSPTPSPSPTPACVDVSVPTGLTALTNTTLIVPVNASDTTGKGIISFDFTLTYNPGVLTPLATPFDQTNTLSSGYNITVNSNTPGQLVVSGFGTTPLSGIGTILKLRFNVSGASPACSNLNLTGFQLNEGNPCSVTANGQACVVNGTISGNVTYGIVDGPSVEPGPVKPVPSATLSAAGSPNVSTTTDTNGAYLLSGLGGGNYTVTPNKTTPFDPDVISSFDAAQIAKHVVHLITLMANQQIAADTSNNGSISSFDAALIAQTVVGSPNPGIAGTWRFVPSSRGYASTTAANPNQNYEAILVGDVSGNWTPPGTPPIAPRAANQADRTEAVISISLPHASAEHGASITISLTSGDLSSQDVVSYDLDLVFDPAVLQPQASAVSSANTLSNGMNITVNTSIPGHVRVSAFEALPLSGAGTLLNLNFTVVGAPGATTPLTVQRFKYNEGSPQVSTTNGDFATVTPTSTSATISGTIVDAVGARIAGAVVSLSGGQARKTITDADGNYHFNQVEIGNSYTVTPSLANYHFSPANRSFLLLGNKSDAVFTANADTTQSANAIDTSEYFVRQQYVDFLGREPDQQGLEFWVSQLDQCGADAACLRARRIDVSAAFFESVEFQQSGSFVYQLYQSGLGRQLSYAEFSADRSLVVGGANLDANKAAFADAFVQRSEFVQKYQGNTTGASFVDALLQTAHASTGVDLSSERANLLNRYDSGATMNQARGLVLRDLAENSALTAAVYNPSFVLMEYYGYLRRDIDQAGYDFWLAVLNNSGPGEFRGMVCSFVTSAEYQNRFGQVLSHSNAECGN